MFRVTRERDNMFRGIQFHTSKDNIKSSLELQSISISIFSMNEMHDLLLGGLPGPAGASLSNGGADANCYISCLKHHSEILFPPQVHDEGA